MPIIKKMRITILLILVLQLNIVSSQNENLNVTESKYYYSEIKTDSILSIHSFSLGKNIILRNKDRYVLIENFNKNFENTSTKKFKLERKESFLGTIQKDNKIFLFTENYPKNDIIVFSYHIYDIEKNTIEKKELLRTQLSEGLSLFSSPKKTKFAITQDLNSFTIVTYIVFQNSIYFLTNVYKTETFELLYERKEIRDENSFFILGDIFIDNERNVFVHGKSYYNPKIPNSKNKKNFSFTIDEFSKNDFKSLKLKNTLFSNLKPIRENNTYNLLGFYPNGIYNLSIDTKKLEIIKKDSIDFSFEVFKDLYGVKNAEKKYRKDKLFFNLNNLFFDNEHNIYITGQESNIFTSNHSITIPSFNNGNANETISSPTQKDHITYGNIIVMKINKNKELIWSKCIPSNGNKQPISSFFNQEKLHILINEDKKHKVSEDGIHEFYNDVWGGDALYHISFSKDGKRSIKKIQDNRKHTFYEPYLGKYVNNKFIMPSEPKLKNRIMILE